MTNDDTTTIFRPLHEYLANILCNLCENLGGKRAEQERKLNQAQTVQQLVDALKPLRNTPAMATRHPKNSKKYLFKRYYFWHQPQGEDTTGRIGIKIGIQPPGEEKPTYFISLTVVAGGWRIDILNNTNFCNLLSDRDNHIDIEELKNDIQQCRHQYGDHAANMLTAIYSAVLNAVPTIFPTPKGMQLLTRANIALHGPNVGKDLKLQQTLINNIERFTGFLAQAHNLPEQKLSIKNQRVLNRSNNVTGPLTAEKLEKTVFRDEALRHMKLYIDDVDDKCTINLLVAGAPLLDDKGAVLDEIQIIFTANGLMVQLDSHALVIPEKSRKDEPFVCQPERLLKSVRPSTNAPSNTAGRLSQSQAAKNKAYLTQVLTTLADYATDDAVRNKINDVLLLLKTSP